MLPRPQVVAEALPLRLPVIHDSIQLPHGQRIRHQSTHIHHPPLPNPGRAVRQPSLLQIASSLVNVTIRQMQTGQSDQDASRSDWWAVRPQPGAQFTFSISSLARE
jgi:hypothetical protein